MAVANFLTALGSAQSHMGLFSLVKRKLKGSPPWVPVF